MKWGLVNSVEERKRLMKYWYDLSDRMVQFAIAGEARRSLQLKCKCWVNFHMELNTYNNIRTGHLAVIANFGRMAIAFPLLAEPVDGKWIEEKTLDQYFDDLGEWGLTMVTATFVKPPMPPDVEALTKAMSTIKKLNDEALKIIFDSLRTFKDKCATRSPSGEAEATQGIS